MYVSVHVDAEDVLDEIDDDEFVDEIIKRLKNDRAGTFKKAMGKLNQTDFSVPCLADSGETTALLERAYYDLRGHCPSPALNQYFDVVLGRIS